MTVKIRPQKNEKKMKLHKNSIESVNEYVIRFANVNGTGSWSANLLYAKAVFRMGIPISTKNIFPSNIQGLPTWYEVRVSGKGYVGTRGGVDIMLSVNPQSMAQDIASLESGGYFIYDNTKRLDPKLDRGDINFIGLPLTDICNREYGDARQRQLFKNIIYIGALAALTDVDFEVLKNLIREKFAGKDKIIDLNINALELGHNYAAEHFECPIGIRVEACDNVGDNILIDGNAALALGSIYAGATVATWYPITPSTSVVDSFKKYASKMRVDPETGRNNYAILQAEDELSAMGMVLGASWNGARAFTATSGPGVSLMSEFLGFAYFAEVPVVLCNIQRVGPSTGMPTRTQQGDIISCAYASHGDTKHVLLFPSMPKECFDFAADAFDLADRLQTPVIVMSDLDLGMNDNMSPPLKWDDKREYDRGKLLSHDELEEMQERFGRYLDVDGDGIGYRTLPGAHPDKGAFFTRGSSHNAYAAYTEDSDDYIECVDRLLRKWETAKTLVPVPEITYADKKGKKKSGHGILFFGTSTHSTHEAIDRLSEEGLQLNAIRIRAFPFNDDVENFIKDHDVVFTVEQNRDAQMRALLINECHINPEKLVPVLSYGGRPITALEIYDQVNGFFDKKKKAA
jgi:2-oxoglutarate/2-oxoacid ferredoxin oxidoreductase subunit alpha